MDQIPGSVKTSLCFASIVKYAKCFTKAAARAIKLNLEQVFNNELNHLKGFHIETMKLQELYLSSTGKSEFRSGAMVITLNPDFRDLVMISQDDNAVRSVTFGPDPSLDLDPDPEEYLILYWAVLNYLEFQKELLLSALMDELGRILKREMFENGKLPRI